MMRERETVDLHGCPRLVHPITPTQLRRELEVFVRRGGIRRRFTLTFPLSLAREHIADHRRYAQVVPSRLQFEFSMATLWLPLRYRVGLCAHEVGHVLDPVLPHCDGDKGVCSHGSVERRADRMAHERLGVKISYDKAWPGKGLQMWRR